MPTVAVKAFRPLFTCTAMPVLILASFHVQSARAELPPTACFGTFSINVCYSPWKVIRAEPGFSGVVMRKGPFVDADPIYNEVTNQPVVIPVNGEIARSSNRDGGVDDNCPDPGPRPAVNGFIWGYYLGYGKQGWIRWQIDNVTYSVIDPNYSGKTCGPAAFDFDCRFDRSACTKAHACGGSAQLNSVCGPVTYHQIIAVGTTPGQLSDENYYLRYGGDSTTFDWFVPGDFVELHCVGQVDGYSWACVTVLCAKYAPAGCRGYVRYDAVGPSIPAANVLPCYPNLPCPEGSAADCNIVSSDADGDGDVDQADFSVFQRCLSGDGFPRTTACHCFDRDNGGIGDNDVDVFDLAVFLRCLSGPDVPAAFGCDQ